MDGFLHREAADGDCLGESLGDGDAAAGVSSGQPLDLFHFARGWDDGLLAADWCSAELSDSCRGCMVLMARQTL